MTARVHTEVPYLLFFSLGLVGAHWDQLQGTAIHRCALQLSCICVIKANGNDHVLLESHNIKSAHVSVSNETNPYTGHSNRHVL